MLFKKTILDNDNIIRILEHFNFCNITDRGKEIRCGLNQYTNPTSICVLKDENITSVDFARNIQGDIFTLIMENKNLNFREVMSEIRDVLGIDIHFEKEVKNDSIANIYSDLVFKKKDEIAIYEESILEQFDDSWSLRFLNDGISINTQKKFDIRYDYETHRIIIPHRNEFGDICGLIGRINIDDYSGNKYFPLIAHRKSATLFGYSQNYNSLYNADTIYVGEAEKFVMQLDTMGYQNALALSGSSLSKEQIILIAKLMPRQVVFCFDEGLDILQIYRLANKFKFFTEKMNIQTKILIDKNNKYLKKNSKASPTDYGKEVWESLIKECSETI